MEPGEGGYSGISVTGISEVCKVIISLHPDQKQSNERNPRKFY